MNRFQKHIDNLITKILNEEIENKVNMFTNSEWTEIDINEELHGRQKKLDVAKPKGKLTAADFAKLRKKGKNKEVDEHFYYDEEGDVEVEEGNAFTGALAKAKKDGKDSFEVDGKKYTVKEAKKEKWIQKTKMNKGSLHKRLGIPQDEEIPQAKLKSLKKELMSKAEGDKKLSDSDLKLLKQVNLALTLKGLKESREKLLFTENELVDLIENLVIEQQEKETKENISKKEPEGLKKTRKAQEASKKENEDYAKSVVKKMKEYLKTGSNGDFTENPESFPQNNYQLSNMKEKTKKYHPSKAVEEYIENFAYPGMENLDYDEIKPNEDWLKKNIEGSSETGNNPKWANAVETELGKKVNEKRKKNLYQKEKKRSYKRVTQPVDEAGEGEGEKSIDKMFAQLESTDAKKENKINEEMKKMKSLINYNGKTQ